jgi:hypothetical protein
MMLSSPSVACAAIRPRGDIRDAVAGAVVEERDRLDPAPDRSPSAMMIWSLVPANLMARSSLSDPSRVKRMSAAT